MEKDTSHVPQLPENQASSSERKFNDSVKWHSFLHSIFFTNNDFQSLQIVEIPVWGKTLI